MAFYIVFMLGITILYPIDTDGQCSKPNHNETARVEDDFIGVESFEDEATVNLVCTRGYTHATGKPTVKCQDRQWVPRPQDFTCKKKSCPNPELPNGRFDTSNGIDFGAFVTATCNTGFDLVGEPTRKCLADGNWDGSNPLCKAVKCGPPPDIENGYLVRDQPLDDYDYQTVVQYRCNKDFTLLGESKSWCRLNRTWTPPPRCKKVNCPALGNIPNAERTLGGSGPYTYRDSLTYTCNVGFLMSPDMQSRDARIRCEENGWSDIPMCLAKQPPVKSTSRPPVKQTTAYGAKPTRATRQPSVKPTGPSGAKGSATCITSSMIVIFSVVLGVAALTGPVI